MHQPIGKASRLAVATVKGFGEATAPPKSACAMPGELATRAKLVARTDNEVAEDGNIPSPSTSQEFLFRSGS
jgi:hypothetical protein